MALPKKKENLFLENAGDWTTTTGGTFWTSGTAISSATPISVSFRTDGTVAWPSLGFNIVRDVQKVVFVSGNEDWLDWADGIMPGFKDWLDKGDPNIPYHFSHTAFFYAGY